MKQIPYEIIPLEGFCLLSFRDALVFEPYELRDGQPHFAGCERLKQEMPYDCHFFDREKDCHMVFRESRGDFCVTVLTAEEEKVMDPDLIYVEKQLIREEYAAREGFPSRLSVISRYRYSEFDTLLLENYRLSYEE